MRFGNSRKGISPLIAAVLLIAFTMAVAAILTAFVTQFTRQTTQSVGNQSERLIDCSNAGLAVKSAQYNNSATNQQMHFWVNVTVENTGQINLTQDFTITTFDGDQLVDSYSHPADGTQDTNSSKSKPWLEPGKFVEFSNVNDSISKANIDEVKVRSSRCQENAVDTTTNVEEQ